jgi:DNA-binding NtrC family response regulator
MDVTVIEKARILVIDDDEVGRKNLLHLLTREGYEAAGARDGAGGLAMIERSSFDLVITDLVMDNMNGLEVLAAVKRHDPDIEVIIVTGYASIPSAIEAMRHGAFHYVEKPFRAAEVQHLVSRALETVGLRKELKSLQRKMAAAPDAPVLLGDSREMLDVVALIKQVAPTDCNVLLVGESGTGKELAASMIHAHSRRSDRKFVGISCAALTEELLANELFGHERGAFTGATQAKAGLLESADGGTLLLDEVGDMPLSMQVKMLRAIQEREIIRVGGTRSISFDVRVIAATNQDLKKAVSAGLFRHDLYYRLNVITIKIPPLRARPKDIPLLALYFLRRAAAKAQKQLSGFSDQAMEALTRYSFPGNVRELQNVVERAVAIAAGQVVELGDLPSDISGMDVFSFEQRDSELRTLRQIQRDYIEWVLKQVGRNKTKAAELLGIDRASLWRHLKQYELEDDS